MNDYDVNIQYGWVCPKCGRVMAPTMCFCICNGEGRKTISTTSITIDWPHHDSTTASEGERKK